MSDGLCPFQVTAGVQSVVIHGYSCVASDRTPLLNDQSIAERSIVARMHVWLSAKQLATIQ